MTFEAWMRLAHEQMLWIEARRHPVLDAIFLALTSLGAESFLLFFAAIGYWLADRRTFARAAVMIVAAGLLNTYLKGVFLVPRPDVTRVYDSGGWALPSGHAQVGAALWGWLAFESRRREVAVALWLLAAAIAVSRPYLGVHYPHDVVLGYLLGALQVGVFAVLLRLGLRRPATPRGLAIGGVLGILLLWVILSFFHPSVRDLGARLGGAGLGIVLGHGLARLRRVDQPPTSARGRAAAVAIGISGLLVAWLGLQSALALVGLGASVAAAFARYALVGLWITLGTPALVAGLRLR